MTDYEDLAKYGPLTRDAVRIMIYDAIQKIEEKRDQQHMANLDRFDKQDSKLNKIIGAILLIGTLVPIILHFIPGAGR